MKFKTKLDGMQRRKKSHLCTACKYIQIKNWFEGACPSCGAKKTRQYFASTKELNRALELIGMQERGEIKDLVLQPRYNLSVHGKKITTYVADAEYIIDNKFYVEDTKPKNFIDSSAQLKINLFTAIYKNINFHFYR